MQIMKIYTGTGDQGETGLFGGQRVKKNIPQVEAYGTIDELNAHLGSARGCLIRVGREKNARIHQELAEELRVIQNELFILGAELATRRGYESRLKMELISSEQSHRLEGWIDAHEEKLSPLTQFILPSSGLAGSALHIARAICRRAERRVLSLEQVREENIIYLNRLSDYLFTLARRADKEAELEETAFQPVQLKSS